MKQVYSLFILELKHLEFLFWFIDSVVIVTFLHISVITLAKSQETLVWKSVWYSEINFSVTWI